MRLLLIQAGRQTITDRELMIWKNEEMSYITRKEMLHPDWLASLSQIRSARFYIKQALRSKILVTAKGWYLQAFYFDFVKVFINFCCQPLSYDSGC